MVGDPTIADAILDRIIHTANTIELYGESMRKLRSCLKFFLRKFETGFCAGFRRFLRRIAALFYD